MVEDPSTAVLIVDGPVTISPGLEGPDTIIPVVNKLSTTVPIVGNSITTAPTGGDSSTFSQVDNEPSTAVPGVDSTNVPLVVIPSTEANVANPTTETSFTLTKELTFECQFRITSWSFTNVLTDHSTAAYRRAEAEIVDQVSKCA